MTTKRAEGVYLFDTPIGTCGIAWTARGIESVVISPQNAECAVAKPPRHIRDAVDRIAKHLAGNIDDLTDIKVDLSDSSPFARKVYRTLRQVKPGKVITYGELAKRVGSPRAARAVGRAMATNPVPIIVPCHRVISSSGKLGGFSAHGGNRLKARLLKNEVTSKNC
jgi:methylated-DNA-[protein]-cysteine S-methyltransferase